MMSFFKNKNKGKSDIKLDDKTIAVQTTPPTDPTKTLWVDTTAQ